ncbi:MAG: diol dehydratase small subunit [Mycobacterium sp.]
MTASAYSGRPVDEVSVAAARAGDLELDDIRIGKDTLLRQAERAEATGSRQLAANFRRAAELTALSSDEVLAAYEALRPGRSSDVELESLAEMLAAKGASNCAAFVREAAAAYERRGLLR